MVHSKHIIEERKIPKYLEVDGYRIPAIFSVNAFRSAVHYSPKESDVFVCTFPKCGTTWLQHIVALIYRKGEPYNGILDFFTSSPFLEMCGSEAAESPERSSGAIKIHLPYHLAPISPIAKYIYVARNPRDCCVSFYHHVKSLPIYEFQEGTFEDFLELFINGQTNFGDYFDNLLSWYSHRNDNNVLFLTYENLKRNLPDQVMKIAEFLGEEYYKNLKSDEILFQTILQRSSFEYMKKHCSCYYDNFVEAFEKAYDDGEDLPNGIKELVVNFKLSKNPANEKAKDWNFIRKGIIGDWKNHFNQEQQSKMDEWIRKKTIDTDVMDLWDGF
ncbi:sulfotransferase ssu-1-like [Centruroides vittatus]|uniref:sulfotransferase ssu-1-like n=1 Tax=Centruroides vittatus TaxID=120091 RepID=UPI003510873A